MVNFKGILSRDFPPLVFLQKNNLIFTLKPFQVLLQILRYSNSKPVLFSDPWWRELFSKLGHMLSMDGCYGSLVTVLPLTRLQWLLQIMQHDLKGNLVNPLSGVTSIPGEGQRRRSDFLFVGYTRKSRMSFILQYVYWHTSILFSNLLKENMFSCLHAKVLTFLHCKKDSFEY